MPLVLPGHEAAVNGPGSRFDRHHHAGAYAALLVDGNCDEAGDRGRFRARPGDVMVHASFDGHRDHIGSKGAIFINFALDEPLPAWFGSVPDLDSIVQLYERDPIAAAALLRRDFRPREHAPGDWPDQLARDLARHSRLSLVDWADRHGLHPTSVSRGFRLAYGVSPKRFRLERIASNAARRVGRGREQLAEIAAACGFADQAHMARTIRQMFGATPRAIRAAR